ncbi:MAG: Asp-tRNA(Asn)/Glu-tRNA(Gln) amidotransferase subunit GatC [Bacillota bacterium]
MISAEELAQAAEAARMEIPAEEKEGFLEAVNALFAFVKRQWETLDVEGVAPTAYVRPLKNITRPDEPRPSLPLETALANAPEEDGGCFRVPRIIEE